MFMMLPDRVSNPGPLTYEIGALPTALCGPALPVKDSGKDQSDQHSADKTAEG